MCRHTHVVIDVLNNGEEMYSGNRYECDLQAERWNSDIGMWMYRVFPIHK